MAKSWIKEPWAKDPKLLVSSVLSIYTQAQQLGKMLDLTGTIAKRVRENRQWGEWVPQDALEQALVDLNVVYIPKTLSPGPAFAFPVFDALEELRQLQIRVTNPEEWGGIRYLAAVNPSEFVGPVWFGLDDRTIAAAMQHKAVVLVEGPFDLLAVRVCCPDIPSLTTLTKKLTPDHLTTLSLLGVTTVYPMFDHEKSEVGGLAAQILAAKASGFSVIPLVCPAKDPAEALKYPVKTLDLQTLLGRITKPIMVDTASNPLD